MSRKIYLLFLFTAYGDETGRLISPHLNVAATVDSSACEGPREEHWLLAKGEITYEWSVESSGCYTIEAYHPKCENRSFSVLPMKLTTEEIHWDGYLDTQGRWVSLGNFSLVHGAENALRIGNRVAVDVTWVAPAIRVKWQSAECGHPPAPRIITHDPLDHSIHFRSPGCYLLEGLFRRPHTRMIIIFGNLRAKFTSSETAGRWETLTAHVFGERDQEPELQILTNGAVNVRATAIGGECRVIRRLQVQMWGDFPMAEIAVMKVEPFVVQNVMREMSIEDPKQILKRDVRWDLHAITIELITVGVVDYKATTLCTLVSGASCFAQVVFDEPQYPLQFTVVNLFQMMRVPFYVFMGTIGLFICCAFCFTTGNSLCFRRQRSVARPVVTVSVIGNVVDKHGAVYENDPERFSNCEQGGVQFVVGRAPV